MPYMQPRTAEPHTNYAMAKSGGGFEIRPTVTGEALVTLAPDGRMAAIGARWRADAAEWDGIDQGWWHDLYVSFGEDPRQYFAGRAWRNCAVEVIADQAYDDPFGFDLRTQMFPVADINPCRCRYGADDACDCGHRLGEHGFSEAAARVHRSLYGPDSLG
ncbi:hypothetical protein [Kitasatospora sp. NPDC127060]|uniref:hypothetical protein n=1 Tax=Kitasatospora sp. NPDC127060 TaxID=3347121 RepID=UPI003666B020